MSRKNTLTLVTWLIIVFPILGCSTSGNQDHASDKNNRSLDQDKTDFLVTVTKTYSEAIEMFEEIQILKSTDVCTYVLRFESLIAQVEGAANGLTAEGEEIRSSIVSSYRQGCTACEYICKGDTRGKSELRTAMESLAEAMDLVRVAFQNHK